MNKTEFISFIENPTMLNKSHISALRNITTDFPFFQASYLLLTKALYNEQHYEFENQIKSTALLVSDREILYRFLNNLPIDKNQKSDSFKIIVAETEINDVLNEVSSTQILNSEIITEEIILDVEIISDETAEQNLADENLEINKTLIIDSSEKHTFAEWLSISEKNFIKTKTKHISEINIQITNEQHDLAETPKSNIPDFEKILDKFIRENPSISRPKAEFYNPANMAKYSVEDDDEIVTETLANIYYKQGAYKKAIRAYEKLCLIYPHKLTFFASLIKKIKEENKND